ncbi:AbrB/MazE/SpoVT family DNA-binding domain-containing protein [Bacillus haynesii]|uniref:AbrB/MazE/SpoVT family DNA-binding domain-containing protein n=1 Tax=Bacillus TaxID=1386 RepID=UPI00228105A2|nr:MULTISPECIES: AbrB/MazE/SpoVT family DNA-binding domain-containing protein [Bacillus]MCY7773472.1 AbrB/MazE/SpoVT family DNA-binding domain-containing protein [Bacillus licheniformis]MCY7780189.1 AbrB/MazE/SpoVT family DNA-binding domain-containing protein [Bacillus haynesii]MCY8530047.1 AbrB/MazE/SpoVT family DNA-binding domain-containing protein [Bacillus licheniformis]MCY9266897.1 AbrB/MazE/SpoVT family DNA-binding domain-containing protein [Bacillus licheniformis]MCY9288315.1 AbrB/MazE/
MKSTGIVRQVDELGRIVIPKELRRVLNITDKDPMEIFVEDEKIILRKYKQSKACVITGEVSDQNMTLSGGIVLSIEGAKILLEDLIAVELNKKPLNKDRKK